MKSLPSGTYFGDHREKRSINGLIISDTDYTHDYVDWHYHENAYFTLMLRGKLIEKNRQKTNQLVPGDVLFHHWQEPHCNTKESTVARGFHIEVTPDWFKRIGLDKATAEGNSALQDPGTRLKIERIFRESKIKDHESALSIDALLVDCFATMTRRPLSISRHPEWVEKIGELLEACDPSTLSLDLLAREVDIHPVHLSRSFHQYFHRSFGEYVRELKLQRSLSHLRSPGLSIAEVSVQSGFTDASHFIRVFRHFFGMSPTQWRKEAGYVKHVQRT